MVRDREFAKIYITGQCFFRFICRTARKESRYSRLVEYFVQQFANSMEKAIETIPEDIMRSLVRYPWPGNIRELQNYIAARRILSNDGVFEPAPLKVPAPEPRFTPPLEDRGALQRQSAADCAQRQLELGGHESAQTVSERTLFSRWGLKSGLRRCSFRERGSKTPSLGE